MIGGRPSIRLKRLACQYIYPSIGEKANSIRDALALNIGPEDWQHTQALSAFRILDSRPERFTPPSTSSFAYPRPSKRKLQLFISMDMDALPKWSAEDGDSLRIKVVELMRQESYLRWEGQRVLSTFSGHDATFGGIGWEGWLKGLNGELGEKVSFLVGA